MNLSKPLVPQHADGVLRVLRPKRASTVVRAAALDAARRDDALWLGGVYAGATEYCHPPGHSDKSISSLVAMLARAPYDLVLVGEVRELTRNPGLLWPFIHNCLDTGVRLIAWRDRIDTAGDDWRLPLHVATLRLELFSHTRRLKKGVSSSK